MPFLRRQRRAPSAPCAGLQSRQLHADAGDAPSDGVVVPDQPAREADQDRREGHQPWPLRDLPNGRGRSLAADVRRHPVADRPAAGAARPGMRDRRHQMRPKRRQRRCALIPPNQRVSAARCRQLTALPPLCGRRARFTLARAGQKRDPWPRKRRNPANVGLHLYDRLSPYLSPPCRVVLFDFLGWGSSGKPSGYPYTTDNQVGDLDAVITQLGLGQVVLVAHDASGPPAIDWALAYPERLAGLVLLNTYYCEMPTLRRPEAIWLFSTPVIRSVARPVSRMFGNWLFRRMYWWQVGRFIRDADVRREFVPLLYQQFDATPSARPAFFRLNEDLLPMVRSHTERIPWLREFKRPVRIIFGDADYTLNSGVARTFHEFLPGSELFLIPGARHFVQLDEPEQVARLILAMPLTTGTPA